MDEVTGIAPVLQSWEDRVLLLHHTSESHSKRAVGIAPTTSTLEKSRSAAELRPQVRRDFPLSTRATESSKDALRQLPTRGSRSSVLNGGVGNRTRVRATFREGFYTLRRAQVSRSFSIKLTTSTQDQSAEVFSSSRVPCCPFWTIRCVYVSFPSSESEEKTRPLTQPCEQVQQLNGGPFLTWPQTNHGVPHFVFCRPSKPFRPHRRGEEDRRERPPLFPRLSVSVSFQGAFQPCWTTPKEKPRFVFVRAGVL